MDNLNLGAKEAVFADLIWSLEPISFGELAKLCEERLLWKKTTTHTVLKRLCSKGLFKDEKGVISSQISRNSYLSVKSRKFVDDYFGGSLSSFIEAYHSK